MAMIWSLLTSKLTGPIAAALAVLFLVLFLDAKADGAGVAKGLRKELATAEGDALAAQRDLTQCRSNEGVLQAALGRQSFATLRVAREGRERTEAAQRALESARTATVAANRRADRILAARPAPGADLCAAADALILGEVQ